MIPLGIVASSARVTAPPTNDYSAVVLADSPTVYYRLGSSASMLDSSGNERHGSHTRNPVEAPGLVAGVDTSLDYVQSNAAFSTGASGPWVTSTGSITGEAWAEVPSSLYGDPIALILNIDSGNTNRVFGVRITSDLKPQFVYYLAASSGDYRIITGPNSLVAGGVYHFVATYDKAAARLYVNGVEVASESRAGSINPWVSTPFYIGREGGFDRFFWRSRIDEVALYDYALPPGRVLAHYSAGVGAP